MTDKVIAKCCGTVQLDAEMCSDIRVVVNCGLYSFRFFQFFFSSRESSGYIVFTRLFTPLIWWRSEPRSIQICQFECLTYYLWVFRKWDWLRICAMCIKYYSAAG